MLLHALLNVILGMGSVFLVLILISLVIYCFNIFPVIEKKFKKQPEKQVNTPELPKELQILNEAVEEDEGEIVAAIMAAITAYTGMSQDDFVVRSIVRR